VTAVVAGCCVASGVVAVRAFTARTESASTCTPPPAVGAPTRATTIPAAFSAVAFATQCIGVAGGRATGTGLILYTRDGGQTWRRGQLPRGVRQVIDIAITPALQAAAIGEDAADRHVLLLSVDGGGSWRLIRPRPSPSFFAVAATRNRAWAVGQSNRGAGVVYVFKRMSVEWSQRLNLHNAIAVGVPSRGCALVAGTRTQDAVLVRLRANGSDCGRELVAHSDEIRTIAPSRDGREVWAGGSTSATSAAAPTSAVLFETSDLGRTWHRRRPPASESVLQLTTDHQSIWAVIMQRHRAAGALRRSNNRGHSWTPVSIRCGSTCSVADVAATPYAVWIATTRGLYFTRL
jgi:photosystem II stability/assembly factor-like uncharacterized protein